MLTTFTKRNPRRFWKWFSRHEEEFFNINDENFNSLFFKMDKFIEKYNPFLGFEIIKEAENGKKELVITANGNVLLFDTVFALINAAPDNLKERWNFTALRQGNIDEVIIHFEDLTISSKDIYYEIEESEIERGKWDIFIYVEGVYYDSSDTEEFIASTMMSVLDGLIGEYQCANKINELILVEKGELPSPKNILHLKREINNLDAEH